MGAPSYGGGINEPAQESGTTMDRIRQGTSRIEDLLDSFSEPLKPYVHRIYGSFQTARALMVGIDTCLRLADS